ncbi:MAG: PilZ domain-containing protein [Acidobacteria bacterium]|uniref:PilZ domain-containing protein n=1 Tax=Candidatus Polarisedimenticola svalbardensis TaxID=2886004 RepID=A0A8J6Y163_9BACT|nr:PilZ domain-containing protein [Candidatus Polarisedimenticola svalbardensis]
MAPERKTRFKAGIPAVVHYRGRDYSCTAHDLSRTGVMLLGGIPWPSDESVRFRLDAPTGDLHLELSGRVARVSEDKDRKGTALALEFDSITQNERLELEAILQRLIEGQAPGLLAGINPGSPEREIRNALEAIPVSERSSLALRSLRPPDREILIHDGHLLVLDALARNPHLLESELLALLKNINLLSRTVEQIAANGRWKNRPDVLFEIICHVRTPLPLAENLVPQLSRPKLLLLRQKPNLHANIRNKLRNLLL